MQLINPTIPSRNFESYQERSCTEQFQSNIKAVSFVSLIGSFALNGRYGHDYNFWTKASGPNVLHFERARNHLSDRSIHMTQ